MALNIKNPEVERLASDLARMTGETKTEAIRRALEDRRGRIASCVTSPSRARRIRRFLEEEAWPNVPRGVLGKPISRKMEDAILGYGARGV